MVTKVKRENLYLVRENDLYERAFENAKMNFAVTKVVQIVLDEEDCVKGILSALPEMVEGKNLIKDYMVKEFTYIVEDEYENIESLANTILTVHPNFYLLPVIDVKGKLLYAYQMCNDRIESYRKYAGPRFSFEAVISCAKFNEKVNRENNILICSNLGKCEKSIEMEDIKNLDKDSLVILGFNEDFLAVRAATECMKYGIKYKAFPAMDKNPRLAYYSDMDEFAKKTFDEIAEENGKYVDWLDFQMIFQTIKQTEDLEGAYVEIGTYRGDSAKAALEYMKQSGIKRESYFLDTYEGFSYEAATNSSDALWAGSHMDTSRDLVEKRLSRYENKKCIQSNIITDELPEEIEQIAVCNIDVDMYEPTKYALEKVRTKMVSGGIILSEDYGHSPQVIGAQVATNEFLEKYKGEFIAIYGKGSQLILIKK